MRIERFDLIRYGAFTDYVVDFGEEREAGDLHIIYGANEAGKSTFRDAVIDFLYGFPRQTSYNFLHANDALQIGAALSVADQPHNFTRVKRNQNSLLAASGQPVAEDVLKAALGDITRARYATMFSLDEDTLQQGGESILRSEGDLGELLFAAASGLSGLSGALDAIRAETAEFYKKPGRSHRLADAKKRLDALRLEIRQRDVLATTYDALVKDEAAARDRYEVAKAERDQNAVRAEALKALIDCVDPWREYQELIDALEGAKDAPELPEGWLDEAERLSRDAAAAKTAMDEAKRSVGRVETALDAIDVDPEIVALGTRIERLSQDDFEAKFLTAKDIASRQRELTALEDDIRIVLRRLGAQEIEDPAGLLIPAATVGRINELIEQRSGIEADERSARDEVERAEDSLKKAKGDQAAFADLADLSHLAERFATLREDGDERERTVLERRCGELEEELCASLASLAPWQGGADDLVDLPMPDSSQIEALKRAGADIEDALTAHAREIERLEDERARLSAEIDAAIDSGGLIDDGVARRARDARNAAWEHHRDECVDGRVSADADLERTADAFESAMAEDDRITEARLLQSTDIAALRRLKTDLARCNAAISREEKKHASAKDSEAALQARTGVIMGALSLPGGTPIVFLETWAERRYATLAKRRELKRAEAECSAVTGRIEAATEALEAAMVEAGLDPKGLDWRTRVKRCDHAIQAWTEAKTRKSAAVAGIKNAEQDLEARERTRTRAQQALEAWRADWAEAIGLCWLGADGWQATPAEVKEILSILNDLAAKLEKAGGLEARIEAMQSNRNDYAADVEGLAVDAGTQFDPKDPLKAADTLRARLADAREDERRRKEKAEDLAEAEQRLENAQAAMARIETRFEVMAAVFPANDCDALLAGMRRAEKKASLQERIEIRRRDLNSRLEVAAFEEAEKLLAEQLSDPEALVAIQSEHAALVAGAGDATAHVSSLFHGWKTAETALAAIGGDAQVARLEEERSVLLLDICAEAERFMTLSAGAMMVERALSAYRDTHRSSMMESASKALKAITRGAFSGLAAMPGKDREVLVGLRSDGSSIVASEMSRGTRFQLYLALRIAGHAEFVRHREPLPFFADDILEPFDDDRSAETFALMADMAKDGQVIYLTHHRHLCTIAQEVCGDVVFIHELPERTGAAH